MAVANHEASYIDFPGLQGVFDPKYRKVSPGWLPTNTGVVQIPYSGVMAEAVQTVAITSRIAADNLLAVGYKGHAGYIHKFGGVDVNIDAVLTENVQVSGAYGYQLSDFENKLLSGLVVYTTNSTLGRVATVSGLYVNSVSFTFNANAESTTSWTFVADSVVWSGYDVNVQGAKGNLDNHCIDPLTWDEVNIFDGFNSVSLTGVQSATFNASLNRTEIFQIGQFTPYDRAVQHPYNVTVSINTLANDVRLVNWWDKFVPSYDPASDACAGGMVIKVRTNGLDQMGTTRDFIIASGLRPTTATLNAAVGSNSTVVLAFEGTSLYF